MADLLIDMIRSHDSRPFWDAVERRELSMQVCLACMLERWPPRSHCAQCHSKQAVWRVLPGTGRVEGYAVTHISSDPRFASLVPMTILAARMDGTNGRMLFQTYLSGPAPGGVPVGRAVNVDFALSPVGCLVPVFAFADGASVSPTYSKD